MSGLSTPSRRLSSTATLVYVKDRIMRSSEEINRALAGFGVPCFT
jgi:hypothetical protein